MKAAGSEIVSLTALTARQLMQLSASAHDELRRRSVIRTANATGCYAEHLFSKAFGWSLEPNSRVGYDALSGGTRFQIKSRRPTARNRSRQLGEFSDLTTDGFDILAAVLFAEDFSVDKAALIPHSVVVRRSYVVKGRHRLLLVDSIWSETGVEDVTEQLRAAEMSL